MKAKLMWSTAVLVCSTFVVALPACADHPWKRELRHDRDARLRSLKHWYRQEREAIDHRYERRRDRLREQIRYVSRSRHPYRHQQIHQLEYRREQLDDERKFLRKQLEHRYEQERDRIRHEYETTRDQYKHHRDDYPVYHREIYPEYHRDDHPVCPHCGLRNCQRDHHYSPARGHRPLWTDLLFGLLRG